MVRFGDGKMEKIFVLVQERENPGGWLSVRPVLIVKSESRKDLENKMKKAGIPVKIIGSEAIFKFREMYHSEEWHIGAKIDPRAIGTIVLEKRKRWNDDPIRIEFKSTEEGWKPLGTYRFIQLPIIE